MLKLRAIHSRIYFLKAACKLIHNFVINCLENLFIDLFAGTGKVWYQNFGFACTNDQ